jgi:hypothetical protein
MWCKRLHEGLRCNSLLLDVLKHHFPPYPFQAESMGMDLNLAQIPERIGTAFGTLERVAKATEGHRFTPT